MSVTETISTPGAAGTAALLDAGAVLPPGSHPGQDADTLTSRTYTHPVLPGRKVVRLVPATLGDAEDLALDFLGLAREKVTEDLGQVRRETLGFPAWALVNDPANGHHALALVKDVERLARTAASRAGAAKDGFEALGVQLGRSVPHFLPTFYEQAARIFLQHDSTGYATVFFGKAREAERVHGLPVDEARQRAVFLEFAFAGALSVKALKEHVRDLTQRLDPAEAWAQYRRLIIERCAAGMPPYAALPQDARKLIRAAGLPRVTEETALLAELLPSPAVVRAPGSFWKAYRPTLLVLAGQDPAVRARLLEIMPAGLGDEHGDEEPWLEILADSGAETLLTDAGEGARTDAAEWLSKWAAYLKSSWRGPRRSPATYELVARMARRLRADGTPADLFRGGRWRCTVDLDLLDACLAHGVPVMDPPERGRAPELDIDGWFGGRDKGRRDLAAVAADKRFAPMLRDAVGGRPGLRSTGNRHLHAIVRQPVLRDALSDWLAERADEFTAATGLPGARSVLDRIHPFRTVAAEVNPGAVARIARHDLTDVLARTLRAGILDELGWPALEEGMRLLGEPRAKENNWFVTEEAWPALIIARNHKAVVVGPDGILLDHDLRIPDRVNSWQRPGFRYVDGQLLVHWWHDGKQRAYWSARPSEVFTLKSEQTWHSGGISLPLPGGGRATGGRVLHAGDTALPNRGAIIGDGTGHWRLRRTSAGSSWQEYAPATGVVGRTSLPAALAAGVREGGSLLAEHCELMPLQPGLEDSPLGTDGTVLGRWVRADGDRLTAGTPDGSTVSVPAETSCGCRPVPVGALRLPGGAGPVLATVGNTLALYADGAGPDAGSLGRIPCDRKGGEYAAGTPLVPPASFWHAMKVRDEAGSEALRALTGTRAADIARGLAEVLERHRADRLDAAARARDEDEAMARLLPEVTHPALRTGVTAVVRTLLRLRADVAKFADPAKPQRAVERRETAMFEDYRPEHGDSGTVLGAARAVLGHHIEGHWGGGWHVLHQIRAANHVFSGKAAEGRTLPAEHDLAHLEGGWTSDPLTAPSGSMDWTPLLSHTGALAWRAAAPATGADERTALLLLLDALAEGPLAGQRGTLRRVVLREKGHKKQRGGQVLRHGERTAVVLACVRSEKAEDTADWLALDHDPAGAFGPVAHFTLVDDRPVADTLPADRVTALTRLVRERGAAPWRPEAAATLAAAPGCGPAQATLLLAGESAAPHDGALAARVLETIGLTARQARTGLDRLRGLDLDDRLAVLAALLPQDLAGLWESGPGAGPAAQAAVHAWTARFGNLVRVPEDLDIPGLPTGTAGALLNPTHTPWLSRTTVQRLDAEGQLIAEDPSALPGHGRLRESVDALAGLAYELPYGHPLRSALPGALAALRQRLADPGLLLVLDFQWGPKGAPIAAEIRASHGLGATGGAGPDGLTRVGETFVLYPWYGDNERTLLRPAGLTGPDDPALGLVEGLVGEWSVAPLKAILGEDMEQAVHAGLEEDATPGHAQDPGRCVPHLVREAAAAHGLSEDAATLYLQLLALPDPTDRNCVRWTGWKPARTKKARAELAGTDLVVEAKRARAGRSLFLPGGWEALKSPALPVESWKQGLYPVRHHARTVPTVPVPELFARAWQRVREGDAPAFEELITRATRKGRRR
ncbi:hypothetical protein [Streptomyces sp. GC420]|uniref:hypothetical protein n=1 Tax=Streptomyces sp. GC420 TaxID=2697568 RepID=UPI001414F3FD|nr:hypothetical protein [Streptomyces sp. GC420]NBM15501.1 hypothetical protein [Streptomyces sp. GC420]